MMNGGKDKNLSIAMREREYVENISEMI